METGNTCIRYPLRDLRATTVLLKDPQANDTSWPYSTLSSLFSVIASGPAAQSTIVAQGVGKARDQMSFFFSETHRHSNSTAFYPLLHMSL